MDDKTQTNINEADKEYIIITKTRKDILKELDFKDEDDAIMCDTIISSLEKSISEGLRELKTVSIPQIGCARINPVKRKFRNAKLHLSTIRKNVSKEQYKDYVKTFINDLKEKQSKEDRDKIILAKIRRTNKNKYEIYFKKFGRHYAEFYIYSIYWLKEVPFDAEWEEHYQSLKD